MMRAFANTIAPPGFARSILRRVRTPAPTRLPELLDAIGLPGLLSAAASVAFFAILK